MQDRCAEQQDAETLYWQPISVPNWNSWLNHQHPWSDLAARALQRVTYLRSAEIRFRIFIFIFQVCRPRSHPSTHDWVVSHLVFYTQSTSAVISGRDTTGNTNWSDVLQTRLLGSTWQVSNVVNHYGRIRASRLGKVHEEYVDVPFILWVIHSEDTCHKDAWRPWLCRAIVILADSELKVSIKI